MIRKLKEQLSFDDPVCSSITFLCPDCDPNFQNKTGNIKLIFQIFEKAPKIYRKKKKSVLEIAGKKTDKTFIAAKHNFRTHFGII